MRDVVLAVDYDNFYVGPIQRPEVLRHEINRMISLALEVSPSAADVQIRMYGGWLEDGVLTKRGSELQLAVGQPMFPAPHPDGTGLLRGGVALATRIAAVPGLEWRHTFRARDGLPRFQLAERPRPVGCANHETCPMDLLQRISRRRSRECHVASCPVTNEMAFTVREQKMVDSMLCCDVITFSSGGSAVVVLSDDLDVLPGVATAAAFRGSSVSLVRSSSDISLYATELTTLGVSFFDWSAR